MKEWINNLKETEKGRTLLKFILYMIFFLVVAIFLTVGSRMGDPYIDVNTHESDSESENSTTETKELSYLDKQNILLNGAYEFSYTIKGSVNITYEGEYDKGNATGYKVSDTDLVKYSIEDGIVYKLNFNKKEIYEDLYKEVDANLFDFKSLFAKLNATSSTMEKTDTTKTYNYVGLDEYTYKIITNDEHIEQITIEKTDITYNFKFDY